MKISKSMLVWIGRRLNALVIILRCFFVGHDWLYGSERPIDGSWNRECRRCGKRMFADNYYYELGETFWLGCARTINQGKWENGWRLKNKPPRHSDEKLNCIVNICKRG